MMRILICIACCAALNGLFMFGTVASASAQDSTASTKQDVNLKWSLIIQPRVTYGIDQTDGEEDVTRFGLGLRRARFRVDANFDSPLGLFFDVGFGGGRLLPVAFFGYYDASDNLRLRAGYLHGAQPQALIPQTLVRLDLNAHASIAELWGQQTIGGLGRDFGVDATYKTGDAEFSLWLHTGDGNFDRMRGNFWQSISGGSATGGVENTEFAVSGSAVFKNLITDGVQVGGFASYNSSANPNTAVNEIGRGYFSYAAHAYYGKYPGSQPFRAKFDVIGINYEELTEEDGAIAAAQSWLGFSGLAAVRLIPSVEVVARVEQLMPDSGASDVTYLGGGVHFSSSALRGKEFFYERFSLMYTNAMPDGSSAHLVELQGQWAF